MVNLPMRQAERLPVFRSAPPAHAPPAAEVTAIVGIGPVYAERLAAAGITNVTELAHASVDSLSEERRGVQVPCGRVDRTGVGDEPLALRPPPFGSVRVAAPYSRRVPTPVSLPRPPEPLSRSAGGLGIDSSVGRRTEWISSGRGSTDACQVCRQP